MKRKTAVIVISCLMAFCIGACTLTGYLVKVWYEPVGTSSSVNTGTGNGDGNLGDGNLGGGNSGGSDPGGSNPGGGSGNNDTTTGGGSGGNGSNDGCDDEECDIPEYDESGREVFAVVSPVGYSNVTMINQADRLDTLDGKTIALVGGSFMASVTHFELKRLIEKDYRDVTVLMFNEVGTAGNFAVPTGKEGEGDTAVKTQVQRFQDKLKEKHVDAVIAGNGGCGICTMKECGSAIAAEYIGIPAVMVASPTFVEEVHSIGVSRGVPVLRAAKYPGAFASHTEAELKENTREEVYSQVIDYLTKPITQAEINLYAGEGERPYDEIIYYGNYDEVQDYMKYNEWTDGLPVVPPTAVKVEEYLRFTPYKPDDILGGDDGMILQANRKNYVYTVAANAVMSGVPAEFMPLCVAFVECMDRGDFYRTLISTHGWSPYAWINGPVARQLGIDHGQGAISEENNKALGRFIDLAMLNIGGYYVKENRAGTFGYLTPFTFAEDEEACLNAGWQPYHVTQGFGLDASTITAASALAWGNNVAPSTSKAEEIMKVMAFDITEKQENGLGTIDPHVYRTVLLTRDVAKALSDKYKTKNALEDALIATARRPVAERAYALYYGNTGSQPSKNKTFEEYYDEVLNDLLKNKDADTRETDPPEWLKKDYPEGQKIYTFATMKKGETPFIVTGDISRNKFQVMPGGGYATVEIKLPDNWDELVLPLGYEPLSAFYLEEAEQSEEKTPISVPDALPDGTYIMVSNVSQVTASTAGNAANKLHFSGSTVTIYKDNAQFPITLDIDGEDMALANLLSKLKAPCSFAVEGGIITKVFIRPTSASNGNATTDLSALRYVDYGTAEITFAINLALSSTAGGITRTGTTVIISATIEQMHFDMGGTVKVDGANTADFITYAEGKVTVNSEAAVGSVAKFTSVDQSGVTHTVTFTMGQSRQISIAYSSSGAST